MVVISDEKVLSIEEVARLFHKKRPTAGKLDAGRRASAMGDFSQKDGDAEFHDSFRSAINAWNKNLRSGEEK
jgi:hypothetical protein